MCVLLQRVNITEYGPDAIYHDFPSGGDVKYLGNNAVWVRTLQIEIEDQANGAHNLLRGNASMLL